MIKNRSSVLVTGALRFVGLNIVYRLARVGWRVGALTRRAPDKSTLSFLGNHKSQVNWVEGDVTDRAGMQELVQNEGITHILHAAAVTATPDEEYFDPAKVFDVNAGGTLNMLEAGRSADVKRLVFVSSSGIYGAAPPTPLKQESESLDITNVYTIAKQASEHLCRRYSELTGMSVTVGRLGSAYGPMERTTGSRLGLSRIHQAVHAALEGQEITVFGARTSRDYCYVNDVAEAFASLLEAEVLNHNVYNVGGNQAETLRTALDAIREAVPTFNWQESDDPEAASITLEADKARAGMDLERLKADTGWCPHFDLYRGVLAYISWLQEANHDNSQNG